MIRRPPRSTLFPTRRSSDLRSPHRGLDGRAVDAGEGGRVADGGMDVRVAGERPEALLVVAVDGCLDPQPGVGGVRVVDRKSTRLNSSHANISYAVFCLKKTN